MNCLAAAAVVVATAVIAAVVGGIGGAAHAVVAAAAEQNQQNDDPAEVATTEAVVIHRKYLHREISAAVAAHSMVFSRLKNVRYAVSLTTTNPSTRLASTKCPSMAT